MSSTRAGAQQPRKARLKMGNSIFPSESREITRKSPPIKDFVKSYGTGLRASSMAMVFDKIADHGPLVLSLLSQRLDDGNLRR